MSVLVVVVSRYKVSFVVRDRLTQLSSVGVLSEALVQSYTTRSVVGGTQERSVILWGGQLCYS